MAAEAPAMVLTPALAKVRRRSGSRAGRGEAGRGAAPPPSAPDRSLRPILRAPQRPLSRPVLPVSQSVLAMDVCNCPASRVFDKIILGSLRNRKRTTEYIFQIPLFS